MSPKIKIKVSEKYQSPVASRQTNAVLTRFVSYLTIYYYFFDHFKEFLKTNASTVTTNLLSGALAGGVAKTTIAPLDRAKINFQIQYVLMDFTFFFLNFIEYIISIDVLAKIFHIPFGRLQYSYRILIRKRGSQHYGEEIRLQWLA